MANFKSDLDSSGFCCFLLQSQSWILGFQLLSPDPDWMENPCIIVLVLYLGAWTEDGSRGLDKTCRMIFSNHPDGQPDDRLIEV